MFQGANSNEWTKSLLKTSMRFLQLALFFLILSIALFWCSLFLHVTVIHSFVPSTTLKWPVFLQFNECMDRGVCTHPVGVVVLDEQGQGRISPPPSLIVPEEEQNVEFFKRKQKGKYGKKYRGSDIEEESSYKSPSCGRHGYGCNPVETPQIFSRGQSYSAQLLLQVPDSPSNRHLGMFQVELSLHDKYDKVITSVRRPVRIPYQSYMHRIFFELIRIPFIFWETGTTVSHSLSLPMIESYFDDSTRPAHHLKVKILSHHLEWESCHVEFVTRLTGLRYLLHYHPILSFFLSVSVNIFAFTFIGAIMLHYLRKSNQYTSSDFISILRNSFFITSSLSSSRSIESSSSKEFEEDLEIEEVMSPEKKESKVVSDEVKSEPPVKTELSTSVKSEPISVKSEPLEEEKRELKTELLEEFVKNEVPEETSEEDLHAKGLMAAEYPDGGETIEVEGGDLQGDLSSGLLSEGKLRLRLTKESLSKRELSPSPSTSSDDRSEEFTILTKSDDEC